MFKRNLLSVLALGAFVALATGSEESDTTSDDWEIDIEDGTTTAPSGGAAIEVSSKDISAEYDKNEIAADNKYKGKKVKVTGKIDDIGKDFMDESYVTLEGADLFQGVQVYFKSSEESKLGTLEKGSDLTIEGECDGMLINVQIVDAVIQ